MRPQIWQLQGSSTTRPLHLHRAASASHTIPVHQSRLQQELCPAAISQHKRRYEICRQLLHANLYCKEAMGGELSMYDDTWDM